MKEEQMSPPTIAILEQQTIHWFLCPIYMLSLGLFASHVPIRFNTFQSIVHVTYTMDWSVLERIEACDANRPLILINNALEWIFCSDYTLLTNKDDRGMSCGKNDESIMEVKKRLLGLHGSRRRLKKSSECRAMSDVRLCASRLCHCDNLLIKLTMDVKYRVWNNRPTDRQENRK